MSEVVRFSTRRAGTQPDMPYFLTDAETCYATKELKLLATAWATSKCRLYLFGLPHFTLTTDHRPLIPILNFYTQLRITTFSA